jgi:hypothetical protein
VVTASAWEAFCACCAIIAATIWSISLAFATALFRRHADRPSRNPSSCIAHNALRQFAGHARRTAPCWSSLRESLFLLRYSATALAEERAFPLGIPTLVCGLIDSCPCSVGSFCKITFCCRPGLTWHHANLYAASSFPTPSSGSSKARLSLEAEPVELADAFRIDANYFAVDDRVLYGQSAESHPQSLEPQGPEVARHQTALTVLDIGQPRNPSCFNSKM